MNDDDGYLVPKEIEADVLRLLEGGGATWLLVYPVEPAPPTLDRWSRLVRRYAFKHPQ